MFKSKQQRFDLVESECLTVMSNTFFVEEYKIQEKYIDLGNDNKKEWIILFLNAKIRLFFSNKVIGYRGEEMRKIELKTGCKIRVESTENMNRTLKLIGDSDTIDEAKQIIDRLIRQSNASRKTYFK